MEDFVVSVGHLEVADREQWSLAAFGGRGVLEFGDVLLALQIGDRGQKLLGVAVQRRVEHLVGGANFHDVTAQHHDHTVDQLRHHGQVVGDVEGGNAVALCHLADGLQHVRLGGDVETGGGFVENEHVRV